MLDQAKARVSSAESVTGAGQSKEQIKNNAIFEKNKNSQNSLYRRFKSFRWWSIRDSNP